MSLAQDFETEKIIHLDLSEYAVVKREDSVSEVLDVMRRERVSAVLVEDGQGKLAGIFTERDVLLKVFDDATSLQQPVGSLMTTNPRTVTSEQTVGRALHLMNAGGYRNVPVLDENGGIVGNVSHRILIRFLTDRFPREIYNLPPDPELIPKTREGA